MTDFPTQSIVVIPDQDKILNFRATLSAGQSLYSRLTQVVNGNPAPGSEAAKIKAAFTYQVGVGTEVDVNVLLGFNLRQI